MDNKEGAVLGSALQGRGAPSEPPPPTTRRPTHPFFFTKGEKKTQMCVLEHIWFEIDLSYFTLFNCACSQLSAKANLVWCSYKNVHSYIWGKIFFFFFINVNFGWRFSPRFTFWLHSEFDTTALNYPLLLWLDSVDVTPPLYRPQTLWLSPLIFENMLFTVNAGSENGVHFSKRRHSLQYFLLYKRVYS